MATLVATAAKITLTQAISAAAGITSAVGTIAAGQQAKATANFEAQQLDKQGKEEFASKQREALQHRREKEFILSKQQNVAADSGLGALDDTVLDLAGDVEAEGRFREKTAQYEGVEAKKGRANQAAARRLDGKQRERGSYFSAAGTIMGGIGKYASSRSRGNYQTSQLSSGGGSGNYRYG